MSMHMVSVKQIFGLVGVCLHYNFSWSDNLFFFFAVLCRPNTFWSMYPGTVWCTQMLRIAILKKKKKKKKHCYQYKDFNHRCKGGYILGKTPVSRPITTGYSLPPTWDRFRQKKKSSWIGNDRAKLHELALDSILSWSTAADSCPPSGFSDRSPISISMTTGRKWLTWNRSIGKWTATANRSSSLLLRYDRPL